MRGWRGGRGKNVGEKRREGGREEESARLSGGQSGKDTTAGVWGPRGEGLAARRQKREGELAAPWWRRGSREPTRTDSCPVPPRPPPQGCEGPEKGWQDPSPTDLTSHSPDGTNEVKAPLPPTQGTDGERGGGDWSPKNSQHSPCPLASVSLVVGRNSPRHRAGCLASPQVERTWQLFRLHQILT